ncbi:YeeE/YedE family protein [Pseudomonadales bacterium]|nr:YeeE/YedE family protein [Pseudomonadales bacterium]MDC6450359.1 YeeE/YedE family protein [Pseudomonadales bacterium]MDG0999406.1 YeeE/YedE family protein [Pseudomonadales bacterium]
MEVAEFEALLPLAGGLSIGLAATLLLMLSGRIAGVCGIAFGVLTELTSGAPRFSEISWRVLFIVGLVGGAALYHFISGAPMPKVDNVSIGVLISGGFIVGLGTKIGSGCTSGHGVCGLGRLSLRSFVATCTFMLFGVISVYIFRHLLGVI